MEKLLPFIATYKKPLNGTKIYSRGSDGVRKALDNHTGHVADINTWR
jgi:hypothetical protein